MKHTYTILSTEKNKTIPKIFSFEKKNKEGKDGRDDKKLMEAIENTILKHRKLTAGKMIKPEDLENIPLDKQCGWYLETTKTLMNKKGYYLFGTKQPLPTKFFQVIILNWFT